MPIDRLPKNNYFILFDNQCNLCNSAVNYVIKRDKKNVFKFIALKSDLGIAIQAHLGYAYTKTNSILLFMPKQGYYIKSAAVLEIIKHFSWHYKPIQIARVFPLFLRDMLYDFISNNRHKWFNKTNTCQVSNKGLESKFLS